MPMRVAEFDYHLPDELIASRPAARREDARMMVVDRARGCIEHRHVGEFAAFIRAGDLCVFNDTRVVPARLFTEDGRVELLWLEEPEPRLWRCLVKPGRRARPGTTLHAAGASGTVEGVDADGARLIRWDREIDLDEHGSLALPPYMGRQAEDADRSRYQTVYARHPGSVAAPTAGLHFSPDQMAALPHAFVTLHVGIGTFRPVQAETVAGHRMHAERFRLEPAAAAAICGARRVVAIGTTTVRVLEHLAALHGEVRAGQGSTNIFIHPPYEFRATGALLTNFHLPKSTLLMLVSAFAGRDLVRRAYSEAVAMKYRFFSYGDCMFIV
jgi:S-adenosylmethionine:tRNA ribosyltransferase-isomerase